MRLITKANPTGLAFFVRGFRRASGPVSPPLKGPVSLSESLPSRGFAWRFLRARKFFLSFIGAEFFEKKIADRF